MFSKLFSSFKLSIIFLLTFIIFSFSSPIIKVHAEASVTVINQTSNIPVNTVSDGSISICFPSLNLDINDVTQILRGNSKSFNLPAGTHTFFIVSISKSSLSGNIIDPCSTSISDKFIISGGDLTISDNQQATVTISGTGLIEDPRSNGIFNSGSGNSILPANTSRPSGIYVSYPDFYINENNENINGPLLTSQNVCIAGSITSIINGSLFGSNEIYIPYNTPLPPNNFTVQADQDYTIFPPNANNSCSNPPSNAVNVTTSTAQAAGIVFSNGFRFSGITSNISTNGGVAIENADGGVVPIPNNNQRGSQINNKANNTSNNKLNQNIKKGLLAVRTGAQNFGNNYPIASVMLIFAGGLLFSYFGMMGQKWVRVIVSSHLLSHKNRHQKLLEYKNSQNQLIIYSNK
jgi:hypothetical protein